MFVVPGHLKCCVKRDETSCGDQNEGENLLKKKQFGGCFLLLWSISAVIEKHSILIESNCFNSVAMNYTQVLCTCTWRGIVLNSTMKFESSEVWGILKPHGGFRQCDCLFNPIQRHPTGETAGWMMMIWMSSMKMSWIRPMAGTCGSLGSCRILSILGKESHTKMNIQLTNLSGVRIRTSMVRGL